MSKHTKGPWSVQPTGETGQRGPTVSIDASPLKIVARPDWHGIHEEYLANARLIAAAPELLEALDELVERVLYEKEGRFRPQLRRAQAAIAKATGQPQPE